MTDIMIYIILATLSVVVLVSFFDTIINVILLIFIRRWEKKEKEAKDDQARRT